MNNDINNESTENVGFKQWADKLSKMSDFEVSRELYNKIVEKGNLDPESLELFKLSYEYCIKLITQNKPLEPNLLKIYLEDIHKKNVNQINTINLFALLGMCGINFSK